MAAKRKAPSSPNPTPTETPDPAAVSPADTPPAAPLGDQIKAVATEEEGPPPKIGPTTNPRDAFLKTLHRKSLDETGNIDGVAMNADETDIDPDGPSPTREALAAAAAAEANAAAGDEGDEPTGGDVATPSSSQLSGTPPASAPEPAPVSAGPKVHRVEIRGVVHEVPEDDVVQAGLHAMRNRGAAELALREAHELLNQAKTATAGTTGATKDGVPASDISEDARRLAQALQMGSNDDAAKAVTAMMKGGHSDVDIQGVVARTVETHVRDVIDQDKAAKGLEEMVPEMLKDRRIMAMLQHEERLARANGDARPYTQLYPEIGKKVRDWLDELKGSSGQPTPPANDIPSRTLQQRTAAKAATPAATPPRGAPPSATSQTRVKSGSEVVAEMRSWRGNPDYRNQRRI